MHNCYLPPSARSPSLTGLPPPLGRVGVGSLGGSLGGSYPPNCPVLQSKFPPVAPPVVPLVPLPPSPPKFRPPVSNPCGSLPARMSAAANGDTVTVGRTNVFFCFILLFLLLITHFGGKVTNISVNAQTFCCFFITFFQTSSFLQRHHTYLIKECQRYAYRAHKPHKEEEDTYSPRHPLILSVRLQLPYNRLTRHHPPHYNRCKEGS